MKLELSVKIMDIYDTETQEQYVRRILANKIAEEVRDKFVLNREYLSESERYMYTTTIVIHPL